MLHLTLYNYNNANNKIDKSGFLTVGTALTGDQIDEQQTLTDVEIIIKSTATPTFNYCRISEFNRYYFIENITWLGGTAFQLSLHVDVLYTYAANINALTAYVDFSLLGSSLEYDPRMNYVDQPVVTRTLGSLYPNFLLDAGGSNIYSASPMVMIRYYDLPERTGGGDDHDDDTTVSCAFMLLATFNALIDRYLNPNVLNENQRVDFGSKIIDVSNVYYINQYRLSQATIGYSDLTIRTPKYPAGITLSLSGAGVGDIYVINTPASVGALGYALVQGGTIATPTYWAVGGQYITKMPYIGEFTFEPATAGIKTAETIYYAVAIDPYNAQYIVTPTNRNDGTGTWYFESEQHVAIKTGNAFPIDISIDNANIRKIQLAIGGIVKTAAAPETGALMWAHGALGDYMSGQKIDAADAAHYKYTGEFNGAAEWTPADTKRLVNTSVIVEPDTSYSSFWSEFGRPDHEIRTLSALTGYYKIREVNMRGFSTATKSEVNEIEKLLKAGVIA